MSIKSRFLRPDTVRRLGRVEMKARHLVEGFLAGLHRSPYRGFSVEFAEHRSYVPGDDVRHIDWKVYGKRERYYIKQYHEETNFVVTILLDGSESMAFRSGLTSKLEYASLLAAALTYLVLRQHDAAALGVYDRTCVAFLPAATRLPFLSRLSGVLERVEPTSATDTGLALSQFRGRISRRGIVVVISDFLDTPASILAGLGELRTRGHEVIAVHVLDPMEIEFPLQGPTRFKGMEKELDAFVEPQRIRDAYLQALEAHLHALRQGSCRGGIDYRLTSTGDPVDEFLLGYLATRAKLRRVAR
jgi:uncharacterized protein (DUF58 family)